jgi:CubicO group peptidase (beta-lactamase class C family)
VLQQAVDAKEVPGVVAVAATDQGLLYEGTFGTRALASGPAMTLDSVFRIASMTKAITFYGQFEGAVYQSLKAV